jgi:hypothetical protein
MLRLILDLITHLNKLLFQIFGVGIRCSETRHNFARFVIVLSRSANVASVVEKLIRQEAAWPKISGGRRGNETEDDAGLVYNW